MFLRSTSGEGGSRYVLNLCPEDIKMRPARFPTETFYHLCRWKSLNVINSNVSTTRQSGRTRSELSRTNFFLQRSWKIVWRKLSVQIWEQLKWGSVPRDNVVWMLCRRRKYDFGRKTSLISLENANRGSLFLFFMFVRKNDTDEKWIPFVNVKCFGVFRKMKM